MGVVGRGRHRRSDGPPVKAPFGQRAALRAFGGLPRPPRSLETGRRALCRLRRQRRDSSVARIDNERRSPVRLLDVVLALPDRVVVMDVVFGLRQVLVSTLLQIRSRFLFSEELSSGQLRRTFQRREGVVGPISLQIWLTRRSARQCP